MSNGRNLNPVNVNKEVFLRFNLPPFHILKERFIPSVAEEWRRTNKNVYRKHENKTKIAVKGVSSSLHSFRKKEKERSHIPFDF